MTYVSNDPTWWPIIDASRLASYFIVAAFVAVMYDWALTFGQEVELIWLVCRGYHAVLTCKYPSLSIPFDVPTISLTDTQCWIIYIVFNWTNVVVFAMLWVIIIARLYAMYQGSRKILIFLMVTFLAINTFNAVVAIMATRHTSGEEVILSGTYQCQTDFAEDIPLLISVTWILGTVWEVLALCLAVWIAVQHFRELRQHSAGGIIEDCFMVLMKTHAIYFASVVAVSCLHLITNFNPTFFMGISLVSQIISGILEISGIVQMFVLGPRLILGIREYHARLVADSDIATGMTSIAFQERVEISTGSVPSKEQANLLVFITTFLKILIEVI
ncbi:uncharacterized protein F5891DRAFT_976590 [Suillus fuscotomentosus]|uniref:DUF6533 domain-containing protein n=1 Tax=Suillus fuscotomentosus TaxID=1912939 RepID=A0AAD4EF67_9AGAM|nr:uncharacterized protein F5891DRAFT_976590 [Suillus fuscotomentosus]KAG1905017.1 hypothetical protein F5891DRAFT_976590 [Suillus fuscotomentosus]